MIQIDISMPKTCYECPCHDGDNGSCQITGKYYFDEIPKSCPLKEVGPAELQKNKMTINDIIDILSAIPSRERDRPVTMIGDYIVPWNNGFWCSVTANTSKEDGGDNK